MSWIVLLASRWAGMLSGMVLFGASVFELYAPAAPKSRRGVFVAAASIAAASGLLWAACTVVFVADDLAAVFDPATLGAFFFGTSFGIAWLVRFGLLTGLLGATVCGWTTVVALLSCLLLISQVWLGHAAAFAETGDVVGVMAYALHVLGAAVWVGDLVALVPSVFGSPSEQLSKTLVRFSEVGIVAVLVIVGSGVANSAFHVSDARSLLHTVYGGTIILKAILLAVTDAMAAHNRFHLMGALPGSIGALRRNVLIEQVLLAVLVVAAAALGLEPPS